jgi:hypothetical protein
MSGRRRQGSLLTWCWSLCSLVVLSGRVKRSKDCFCYFCYGFLLWLRGGRCVFCGRSLRRGCCCERAPAGAGKRDEKVPCRTLTSPFIRPGQDRILGDPDLRGSCRGRIRHAHPGQGIPRQGEELPFRRSGIPATRRPQHPRRFAFTDVSPFYNRSSTLFAHLA